VDLAEKANHDSVIPSVILWYSLTLLGTLKKLEAGTLDPPTSKKLVRAIIAKDLSLARSTKKLQRTRK
jgi:hypothetical protein